MRGTDARSAYIRRPDGVTRPFQVSRYTVKPGKSGGAGNLLSKDRCRSAGVNEPEELGPQMPLVVSPAPLPGCAERLAGAGAGPDLPSLGPSGELQGQVPSADSGEEMGASNPGKVIWPHVGDGSAVHPSGHDVSGVAKVSEPYGGLRVDLVVIGTHHASPGKNSGLPCSTACCASSKQPRLSRQPGASSTQTTVARDSRGMWDAIHWA